MRANDGFYAAKEDLYGGNDTTLTSQPKATMMVIQPSFTPEQVARPLVFEASDKFLDDFKETLSRSTAGGSNVYSNPIIAAGMYDKQSAFTAVAPSSQGYITNNIGGIPLEAMWKFIMIVDNIFVDATGREHKLSIHAKGRHVFTGYFLQEPVSLDNFGQGYAVNENATAVVTSHVRLADMGDCDVFNQSGGIQISATNNIVHGSQYRNAYGRNDFYFTTPKEVLSASAVEVVGGGDVAMFASPEDAAIVPASGTVGDNTTTIESSLSAPRDYLHKMTRGFISATNEVAAGGGLGQRFDFGHTTDDSEVLFTTIAGNFNSAAQGSFVNTSQHINTHWRIGEMKQQYPHLEIYPVLIANREQTCAVANATSQGIIAILTSYIADTIPTLMWENNISVIQFRFRSGLSRNQMDGVDDRFNLGGILRPEVIRHFADPGAQVANGNLTKFFSEFKRTIITPIISTFGNFDVMISAGVGGDISVSLQLSDYGGMSDGFHIDSQALGLTNPLVADQGTFNNNAVEIGKCVAAAQEVVGECNYNLEDVFNKTFG